MYTAVKNSSNPPFNLFSKSPVICFVVSKLLIKKPYKLKKKTFVIGDFENCEWQCYFCKKWYLLLLF